MTYTDEQVRRLAADAQDDWSKRYDRLREWRDVRYGRDDVISTIPDELQATDFEYHSSELDDACNELASFLSAAKQTWTASPSKDREQAKADDVEAVVAEVFGPNGVLESESGGEASYNVWQNQVENGHGIYKFTLKKDYPLRMPKRRYSDEEGEGFEPNPDYVPQSRKETREEQGKTKFREPDESFDKRRQAFMEEEFAWQWRSVDPLNNGYFRITKDGVLVAAGEVANRPLSVLDDYDVTVENLEKDYVFAGDPSEAGRSSRMVTTFEFWNDRYCWFGVVSSSANETGRRTAEVLKRWPHPYGRPPYYEAFGLISTDADLSYRFNGAFGKMLSEIPLLNHLETMHFNAVHRGYFPLYYPVKDPKYGDDPNPLDTEQLVGVTQADMSRTELPPGWRWEIMPSGFEPDLTAQLQAARERVESSAVVSVLRGASPSSADSGVKISLLINAATRSISPFVRHHEAPLKEMAETFLRVNKRLKIDTRLTLEEQRDDGRVLVKPLVLKAEDIVTTKVDLSLAIELPVDQAAREAQGMTLINGKMASYETAAPKYLGIGDPQKERLRIAVEGRESQIDDVAFNAATNRFLQFEPDIYREWFSDVSPVEPPDRTVGGGPEGAFGGGAAEIGRGEVASPSAVQVER